MKTDRIISYLEELIPDPKCELHYTKDYELLIAVMLSAQTTDKRVNEVTALLFQKYPSLKDLKEAPLEEITELVKPLGTYTRKSKNVIEIAKMVEPLGYVPRDRSFLESLPGVGRKTANVVLSELYGESCVAVDTHVARVSVRLGLAGKKDDVLMIEKKLTKAFKNYSLARIHHQLLLFGRYHCKAMRPECETCQLKDLCKK